MLTRRGFLHTMAAVAAGAMANFDPLRGLWVPGRIEGAPVPDIVAPAVTWTQRVVDEQLELNELALRFAKEMAARLERSRPVVLRQIMLQHAGHTNLGLITLTDEAGADQGRGRFEPWPMRVMKEMGPAVGGRDLLAAADDMGRAVARADMFVPIGSDLRRGVPFTGCLVGLATDPESGLWARALRFPTIDGQVHTGLELAVGDWFGKGARARRRQAHGFSNAGRRVARVLLSEELLRMGAEDAPNTVTTVEADGTRLASAGSAKL